MQIQQAVPSMNNALKAMGKNGIGTDMAAFEKVFEDLDVQIAGTDGALESITGQSSADSDAVTQLLQQMMGEGTLEQQKEMGNINQNKIDVPAVAEEEKDDVSDMEKRLAALKM